jgi:hypothetical protein
MDTVSHLHEFLAQSVRRMGLGSTMVIVFIPLGSAD